MKFTKAHHDLLVALGSEKWALSTDDSVRAKWRNLLMAIEENVAVECCQRCDSKLDKGLCTDETCPFSETDQDDSRGWAGHPEKDCSEASDMIYSDIHQVLVDIATEQGWNEKSQIIHLSSYIMSISTPVNHFREYLQTCADEENAG